MGAADHKATAKQQVTVAIITLSSTRRREDDESGGWMAAEAERLGHDVIDHRVVTDETGAILEAVQTVIREHRPQILLMNGGTGISPRDVTVETVTPLFGKTLTAFSALFAQLSFDEIGSPAILSRAAAGVIDTTAVFCLPGSLKACQLACESLIFPEMGHLAKHLAEV